MRPLWLTNLKDWATGTAVASQKCLDVNIAQSVSLTTTAPTPLAYKERRFHDAALTNINASGGAWVELDLVGAGTGAALSNTISEWALNWNGGAALEVGSGANSGAVTVRGSVGAGQTRSFGVALTTQKVWVRAIQNVAITSGELLSVFLG